MKFFKTVLVTIIFFICGNNIECAKILSIFPAPSPSHYIYGSALLKELASMGHEITSVSPYPQKKPIKNFKDIFIEKNLDTFKKMVERAEERGPSTSTWEEFMEFIRMAKQWSEHTYEHEEFQQLMASPNGTFDLIMMESISVEALSGLGQHFNAPMIGLSTFGTMPAIDDLVGNSSPSSIIPSPMFPYLSKMTLFERLNNFLEYVKVYILSYINLYNQRKIYYKYLPNAKVEFEKSIKNFSLILLNQHHSLSFPRPYVTNMIEVGGLHVSNKTEPLPKYLQEYLDNATDGAIFFSLGTNIKSKNLPAEKRAIFLNVFRNLKQKVIWKFEAEDLPNKPDNVLISPWLPQQSILAHPNVKVFITHGGLLSTTEAIFFGKPMLGIPMFAEQPRNIKVCVNRGIALSVDLPTLTENEFKHSLNELLYNPRYMEKMSTISSHFHDQPLKPMQLAVYWIEYVLRHNGAKHLRCASTDLNFFQFYSLDVIAIYLSGIFLTFLTTKFILKKVLVLININSSNKNISSKKIKTG